MRVKPKDGKLYAEVTLRDVVERSDVSDLPMLSEIKRLYEENDRLRELARHMGACIQHLDRTDEDGGCVRCPYQTVEHDCGFEQRMRELGVIV